MSKRTCCVANCVKNEYATSYCAMHYKRLRVWGSLDQPPEAKCRECGQDFIPAKSAGNKFCSKLCARIFYGPDDHDLRCSESACDRQVRARGVCNMHYKRILRSEGKLENSPWDERRKANYQKRRALKLQLPADDIRPVDVYERDGWTCKLCELPVDKSLAYPDPGSPSLDHRKPLSRGGHHTWDNVQLAHLQCNVRKGARVEEMAT